MDSQEQKVSSLLKNYDSKRSFSLFNLFKRSPSKNENQINSYNEKGEIIEFEDNKKYPNVSKIYSGTFKNVLQSKTTKVTNALLKNANTKSQKNVRNSLIQKKSLRVDSDIFEFQVSSYLNGKQSNQQITKKEESLKQIKNICSKEAIKQMTRITSKESIKQLLNNKETSPLSAQKKNSQILSKFSKQNFQSILEQLSQTQTIKQFNHQLKNKKRSQKKCEKLKDLKEIKEGDNLNKLVQSSSTKHQKFIPWKERNKEPYDNIQNSNLIKNNEDNLNFEEDNFQKINQFTIMASQKIIDLNKNLEQYEQDKGKQFTERDEEKHQIKLKKQLEIIKKLSNKSKLKNQKLLIPSKQKNEELNNNQNDHKLNNEINSWIHSSQMLQLDESSFV